VSLHGFIRENIEPGSVVVTDGWLAYRELAGYDHEVFVISKSDQDGQELLPRVHQVMGLLKRWLMGTHQGAIAPSHLNDYLDEFTFRFNRRTSASRGKLFYRLAQQAVIQEPQPFLTLISPNQN